ncbi:MAG: hypothetical protein K5622_03010 [Endomicrobiaceae bacterium]|nr:hypothetical protein [Endomicrobiaceae bacterium]
MKKILSVILMLSLFVNVSFAFDPYADEEVEKKSYKKLYYGIVLTLLGGFLAYDGFSTEEVDVSKPDVDTITVSHSEWVQYTSGGENVYLLRSGYTNNKTAQDTQDYTKYKIDDQIYTVEPNLIYNNGNVDLHNVTIEVRYKYADGTYIGSDGSHITVEGYHVAETKSSQGTSGEPVGNVKYENLTLKKGESLQWQDIWEYSTTYTSAPNKDIREAYYDPDNSGGQDLAKNDGTAGLNLGKDSPVLMDVRVKLNKNQQYTPIYEKRHKSDIEGVAGLLVGITGIYFIVDHFLDMHKFNAYAKKHNLNLKIATASNEYKLMLQKRI